VWDAQTSQELFTLKNAGGRAFSPDGTRLAGNVRNTTKVWDAENGQELLSFQDGDWTPNSAVAFSPDGKRLAASRNFGQGGGVGEVVVRDSQTGQELLSLQGHTVGVRSLVFSPDGKRLASGSGDSTGGQSGEVKVWDADTGHELLNLKEGPIRHMAFSPNSQWLVVLAGRTVTIYDATPLREKP